MLSLIYVSMAAMPLEPHEVSELASQAAQTNAALGITGLLAYNSRSFMQLLEGEPEAVLSVMERIERDPRHRDITYIRQDERPARECGDWAMRALLLPLQGAGSASVFTGTLPAAMELDTRILFTSFASTLSTGQALRHAAAEAEALATHRGPPAND